MTKSPTILTVVAAALTGPDGRVLLQKRPPGKEHGGLWEFPGGKLEPGETPANALVRELDEELAITVDRASLAPLAFAELGDVDTGRHVVILLYRIDRWSGDPSAEEGGEAGWFSLAEVADLPMPPLDIDLVRQLRFGAAEPRR